MNYDAVIDSPIGKLGINAADEKLTAIHFAPANTNLSAPKDAFAKKITLQLQSYFKNSQYHFDLPFDFIGTQFQQRVWHAMCNIPVGEVLSYGQLAKQLKTSPRAVGNACRTNLIPIVIPCHRIVAANHLGGFAGNMKGKMIDIKTWLLKHESAIH